MAAVNHCENSKNILCEKIGALSSRLVRYPDTDYDSL